MKRTLILTRKVKKPTLVMTKNTTPPYRPMFGGKVALSMRSLKS